MDIKRKKHHIGVVVGRFQVADLTGGHLRLLNSVNDNCSVFIVVLGCSPVPNSFHNPLTYECRKQMIQEAFPNALIFQLMDSSSDDRWSGNLDAIIRNNKGPHQDVALYGSRDSFISHYTGKFETIELEPGGDESGTVHREEVANLARNSSDFRAGLIAASRLRYPVSYTTVDIACFNSTLDAVLLGKKPGETLWRFPGGFTDPDETDHYNDARRELREETGLHVAFLEIIGSIPIDDWRYRKGPDKIKTLVFAGVYKGDEELSPDDDLEVVEWIPVSILHPDEDYRINPSHRKIAHLANLYLGRKS